MSILQRLRRGFLWPIDALQMEQSLAPSEMSGTVVPVMDVAQGGWGHDGTRTEPFAWETATSAIAATYDLVEGVPATTREYAPSTKEIMVIQSLSVLGVTTGGTAVCGDVWLQYRPGPSGLAAIHSINTVPCVPIDQGAGALGFAVASKDWLPWGPLRVPYGYRPQLVVTFTMPNANTTIRVRGAVTYMARGFSA